MHLYTRRRGGLAALFCGAALLGGLIRHSAQGAAVPGSQTPYNVRLTVYPVTYTDAQKNAQRAAGRALAHKINAALAAGAHSFTIPPGLYRIPAEGADSAFPLINVKNFTLHMAGVELVLENGGNLVSARDCENLAFLGPAKIDSGNQAITQGRLLTYDSQTGQSLVEIMPGYEVAASSKGTVDAFSPAGVYLANPSWASYDHMTVIDQAKRRVQVTLGAKDAVYKDIYKPGVLLAFRLHGSPLLISAQRVNGFTLKDIDVYTGSGIGWGGGTGQWNFLHIRGIRRPGTSRLMGAGGCQMGNYGGSVLFDGCEFSSTADDLVDYGGGGLFTCERQESPRTVISWGGSLMVEDTVNFYDHSGFQPAASAKVIAVADLTDPAIQVEAHHLVKDILKARDDGSDKPLHRITLDRDVTVSAGDYMENGSGNRPDHFTIRNSYFHDSGVRVMVQGFRHGLFENNRFERISGGLALTCDAWWFEGPTCQDITVRNNVFDSTTFRNGWGTGKAAIIIGAGWSQDHTDPSRGCAFHTATVTGNTISNSSAAGIFVSNTDHLTIAHNVIRHPFTLAAPAGAIQLAGVADSQVWENTVIGCPGLNLSMTGSRRISIHGNVFRDAYQNPANPFQYVPNAVVSVVGCTDTNVANNRIVGTNDLNGIWVTDSADTILWANQAAHMTALGAALMSAGPHNIRLRADGVP